MLSSPCNRLLFKKLEASMTTNATKSYYELEEGQKVPLMYYAKKIRLKVPIYKENIMFVRIIFFFA